MHLVKRGVLALLRHDLDVQVVAVLLLDHAHQVAGDAMALVFGIHQHIVHVGGHLGVVEHTHQSDEAVAVPRAEHRGRSHQRLVQTLGIFAGDPADGKEQLLGLLLGELLFIGVRDVHTHFLFLFSVFRIFPPRVPSRGFRLTHGAMGGADAAQCSIAQAHSSKDNPNTMLMTR